jgi:hypothetical protein
VGGGATVELLTEIPANSHVVGSERPA